MNTNYYSSSQRLGNRLGELGFARVGAASFTNGPYRLELGKPWSTFHVRHTPRTADPLTEQFGAPGPWKRICDGDKCRFIADVPLQAIGDYCDLDADDQDDDVLARVVNWVLSTSSEGSLETWQPPDLEEIESWYGPEKLTVVAGPHLRQGTLLRGPGRLAVRIPIVPQIPPELPVSRMSWLRAVLIDAQNCHRAARIGLSGDAPRQAVVAEVDLSGAPADALESLFTSSVTALKNAVQWSIQSAGFLVDLTFDCRALEVRPHPWLKK